MLMSKAALLAFAIAAPASAQDIFLASNANATSGRRLLDDAQASGWLTETRTSHLTEPDPNDKNKDNPVGGEPLALSHPDSDVFVQQCTALFQRTALSNCGRTMDLEVLTGQMEIIAGTMLTLEVKIAEQHFHEVRCAFMPVGVNESLSGLNEDPDEGDMTLPEERHGLGGTILMDIDICNAETHSSIEEPVPDFIGKMQFPPSGELGQHPGFEQLYDEIPVWANELQIKATAREFSLTKVAPMCFPASVVLNQGVCGSCWAHAAASSVMATICVSGKGKNALKGRGQRYEMSVQRFMGCNHGKRGCRGGSPQNADQVFKGAGLALASRVPYRCGAGDAKKHFSAKSKCAGPHWGGSAQTCVPAHKHTQWSVGPLHQVNGEQAIMDAMVAGHGMYMTFQCYPSLTRHNSPEVYRTLGPGKPGGHAVVGLGYGVYRGTPYWWIQNSWGTRVHERGFIKFLRGRNLANIEKGAFFWEASHLPGQKFSGSGVGGGGGGGIWQMLFGWLPFR